MGENAYAITIAELQEQIRQNQGLLNDANALIDGLEDKQDVLEEEIADIDAELINLYTEIGVLEEQIAEQEQAISVKETEIAQAAADLEAAQQVEANQYEAMKQRVRYSYESGGGEQIMSLLMGSKGIGDLLNRIEYIEEVSDYDNNMLLKYQSVCLQVADMKFNLETRKAELEEQKAAIEKDKAALSDQQNYLNGILAQKKRESANYDAEIASAKKKANSLKSQIASDNKKIQQMQEEERRRLAMANGNYVYSGGGASATTIAAAQAIVAGSSGSDLGKKIAMYACQFIGRPYVAGGTSLTNGADCSGFTYRVYADFGYSIPRTSFQQRSAGRSVSLAEAQPGDLICYDGHVAMYIGSGKIVHASSAKTGIKTGTATYKPILAVRRIV